MFPMIPQHLARASVEPPTPARGSLSLDASVERRDGGVRAAEDIPADVVSREQDLDELTDHTPLQAAGPLTVDLDKEGKLRCLDAPGGWMRELRLAGDCHSFNVLLHRSQHSRDRIVLQVVRPIRTGEELQMWFSEQTLAALAMPFLTPANIQGDKRYVCLQCGRSFETPNPLKVHLALQCDQLAMRQLYVRLSANHSARLFQPGGSSNQILNLTTLVVGGRLPDTAFKFELKSPRRDESSPSTSHEKAVEPNRTVKPSRPAPGSRHSAFKPYWKRTLIAGGNTNLNKNLLGDNLKVKIQTVDRPSNMSAFSFLTSVDGYPPYEKHAPVRMCKMAASPAVATTNELLAPHSSSHLADTAANYFHHAAQMETLVSNLGRSKQGHLCIYCGKVYSRKYGLKIHIRTHTGFKPLQCKYCLRPFGDPSNLNKHVRLHAEGATPYKCGLCGKILVRRRDLDRHIKSRHGPGLERPIAGQPSPESPGIALRVLPSPESPVG